MGEEKKGFFKRLVSGLTKTRDNIVSGIDAVFSGFSHIDEEFYEELEEILIMGDLGVRATESILEDLRKKITLDTKAVIINHASNVCGAVQPISEIGRICREKGIVLAIDTAQSA